MAAPDGEDPDEVKRREKIPRVVRVRANVLRVINVDLQQQCFTAVFRLEATWVARELVEAAKRLGKDVSDLKINETKSDQRKGDMFLAGDEQDQEEWFFAPRLYVNNLAALKPEESEEWFTVHKGEEGEPVVCFTWKFKGTFQESMELGKFPFDVQNLTAEIRSGWKTDDLTNGVLLVENLNAKYASNVLRPDENFVQFSEYRLSKRLQIKTNFRPRDESASSHEYCSLTVTMRVERLAGYWIFNVVLPLFIVTSSMFVSYALSPDELSDRSSITLTTLLAMVAFKYVISGKLPDISYATIIDWYVILCFLLAFFIITMQTFSKLELIDEAFFRFTFNNSNQTYTVATDIVETSTLKTTANGQRTMLVSVHLVVLGSAWLAIHVLGFVCLSMLFLRRRWHRSSFWGAPAIHVWLGPIQLPEPPNESKRSNASNRLLAVMNEVSNGSAILANVWWKEEARNKIEALSHLKDLPEGHKQYPRHPFAVISFTSEKSAAKAINSRVKLQKAIDDERDGPLIKETVPLLLNPSYYSALTNQDVLMYKRRVGHAIYRFFTPYKVPSTLTPARASNEPQTSQGSDPLSAA